MTLAQQSIKMREMHPNQLSSSSTRQHCLRLNACFTGLLLLLSFNSMFDYTANAFDTMQLRKVCTELTTNSQCQCSSMMSDFRIECPSTEPFPKITINIRPGVQVQIICNHISTSEYNLLPEMNIGNYSVVQIRHCPLPGGHTPISRIFNRLGITQVNSLLFESSDLGTNLTSLHLKGLLDLGRLRFSSNVLSHMPADLFNDLKNLTWLDLRSNNVDLPLNIFATLENLHFLELGHNNLQQLPEGIFRNQRKLLHLNLWSNQLCNLSKHVFEGVSSVTDLDLSSNGIENFVANVFELLNNLTNINLSANHFRQLPMGLFAKNKNLSQFRLKNNRVTLPTLPDELFANMPHLKEVQLEACDLGVIPGKLFVNSSGLTTLTLADNKLVELPPTLLDDQLNLNELDLSRNRLKALSDELFRHTNELVVLKLSDNQLREISSDLFAPLTKLELLFMDNNQLSTINPDAFMYTQNIRSLSMANNQLNFSRPSSTALELNATPFQHLLKLRSLNLRNNSITCVHRDWQIQLSELQELDLSYNSITTLNETDLQFKSTQKISVNLMRNQIHRLNFKDINMLADATVPDAKSMRIQLNDNPINCDCELLSFVQFVGGEIKSKAQSYMELETHLLVCDKPDNLRGSYVHDLSPSALLCPYGMKDSKQQHCPFGCECWERSYDSVLIISCTDKQLMQIPALPLLESRFKSIELYLTNNNLTQLPPASTPGYANVTRLDIAHNHLSQLEAIDLPPKLTQLDLSNNNFEVLKVSVINLFNASDIFNSIALSGNPWTCSCQNEPLLGFALSHNEVVNDFKQMQCIDPAEPLKAKKLQDLSVKDICPMDKHLTMLIALVISLIGCLIGITLALFYKYLAEIKAWLYANNLCLRCITEPEPDKDKQYDAFISYSHKDEDFILDYIMPELEKGPQPFRLCVHVRDFIVGEFISEQIVRSVEDSRRTIVVLSQNFIESVWARYEFREAHKAALNEGRARVIVILYGDIGELESLDTDLKTYLKMNTYLKWGDPLFWSKLHYAMPHTNSKIAKKSEPNSADDKLELIKPAPVSPTLTTPPADATKNPLVEHLNGSRQAQTSIVTNESMNDELKISTTARRSDV